MSCGVGHSCGLDPAWLWLWRRPAAAAPIWPLAWELPYAVDGPKKKRYSAFLAQMSPFWCPLPVTSPSWQGNQDSDFCNHSLAFFYSFPLKYSSFNTAVWFCLLLCLLVCVLFLSLHLILCLWDSLQLQPSLQLSQLLNITTSSQYQVSSCLINS